MLFIHLFFFIFKNLASKQTSFLQRCLTGERKETDRVQGRPELRWRGSAEGGEHDAAVVQVSCDEHRWLSPNLQSLILSTSFRRMKQTSGWDQYNSRGLNFLAYVKFKELRCVRGWKVMTACVFSLSVLIFWVRVKIQVTKYEICVRCTFTLLMMSLIADI